MNTLQELYIHELQDLWSANNQMLEITAQLRDAAEDNSLRQFLSDSASKVESHNESLAELVRAQHVEPGAEHCKGMEGLVDEAQKHALNASFEETTVRDAAIIAQYSRMTHYRIAGYGAARAAAHRIGQNGDTETLQSHLDEIHTEDQQLTAMAEGS
jgi:ferritin-like metal-binding protein YciE